MNRRWTAVAALAQALVFGIFVFRYVEGESSLLVSAVGVVASAIAALSFALSYRQQRNGKPT